MLQVLVLCTGNSCRSQMMEGYLKKYSHHRLPVLSAGIEAHGLDPRAVAVMKEDGTDISRHTSNHVGEYLSVPFDLVLTVCDHASENCPLFPGQARRLHQNFPDPSKEPGTGEGTMNAFRETRDQIREYAKSIINDLLWMD